MPYTRHVPALDEEQASRTAHHASAWTSCYDAKPASNCGSELCGSERGRTLDVPTRSEPPAIAVWREPPTRLRE